MVFSIHFNFFGTFKRRNTLLSIPKIQKNIESKTDLTRLLQWGNGGITVSGRVKGGSKRIPWDGENVCVWGKKHSPFYSLSLSHALSLTRTHTVSDKHCLIHTHTHTHFFIHVHTCSVYLSLSCTHTLFLSLSHTLSFYLTHTHTHSFYLTHTLSLFSITHTHTQFHTRIHTLVHTYILSFSSTQTHTLTHTFSLSHTLWDVPQVHHHHSIPSSFFPKNGCFFLSRDVPLVRTCLCEEIFWQVSTGPKSHHRHLIDFDFRYPRQM